MLGLSSDFSVWLLVHTWAMQISIPGAQISLLSITTKSLCMCMCVGDWHVENWNILPCGISIVERQCLEASLLKMRIVRCPCRQLWLTFMANECSGGWCTVCILCQWSVKLLYDFYICLKHCTKTEDDSIPCALTTQKQNN